MSQPVKLSDTLVLDARLAGEAVERSIAGQVEFWARLGRSVELLLGGEHVLKLCQTATVRSLSECLESVGSSAGQQRLASYLESRPFPHYLPHPEKRGFLIRINQDGSRTIGRFVNREFKAIRSSKRSKAKR